VKVVGQRNVDGVDVRIGEQILVRLVPFRDAALGGDVGGVPRPPAGDGGKDGVGRRLRTGMNEALIAASPRMPQWSGEL
jgi:hypothetical protein